MPKEEQRYFKLSYIKKMEPRAEKRTFFGDIEIVE
jgi:hypothetical protein